MANRLRFVVKVPAQMPQPMGALLPDPRPFYQGTSINEKMFVPNFGPAVVTAGHKVGDKWLGCSYIAPPWVVPGLGEIEPAP